MAGNTKGLGFVNVRRFVVARTGDADGWARALERLAYADRDVAASALASGWYSLDVYARLIRAVADEIGGGLKVIHDLGRFEAEQDLTVVHRVFLRMLHPATMPEKTAEYWSRFHDTGTWVVTRKESGYQASLSDWGLVDDALCAELTSYLTRVVELGGAKDVRVRHVECRNRGARACTFDGTWK